MKLGTTGEEHSLSSGIGESSAAAGFVPSDTRDPDREEEVEEEEESYEEGGPHKHHHNDGSLWGRAMTILTTIWRGDAKDEEEKGEEEEEKEEGSPRSDDHGSSGPDAQRGGTRRNSNSSSTTNNNNNNNNASHTISGPRPTRRRRSSGLVQPTVVVDRVQPVQDQVPQAVADSVPSPSHSVGASSSTPAKRPSNTLAHPPPNTSQSESLEPRTEDSATSGQVKRTRKSTAPERDGEDAREKLPRPSGPPNTKDPTTVLKEAPSSVGQLSTCSLQAAVPVTANRETDSDAETRTTQPTNPIPPTRSNSTTTDPPCKASGEEEEEAMISTMGDLTNDDSNSLSQAPYSSNETIASESKSGDSALAPCEEGRRQNVAIHPVATMPSCPKSQATVVSAPDVSSEKSMESLATASKEHDRNCSLPAAAAAPLHEVDGDVGIKDSVTDGCQGVDNRSDKDAEDDGLDLIERFKRRPRRAAPQAYFFDMIPENVYDESSEEEVEIEPQKKKKSSLPLSTSKAASVPKRSQKKKVSLSLELKTTPNTSSQSAKKSSSSSMPPTKASSSSRPLSASKAGTFASKPADQTASKSASPARKSDLSSQQQKQSAAVKTPSKHASSPPVPTPEKKNHSTPPNTAQAEVNAPPSSSRSERLLARRSHLSKVCLGRDIAGPTRKRPNETSIPGTAPDQRKKKQKSRESLTSLPTAKSKSSETSAAGVALLDSSNPVRGRGTTNVNQDTGQSPEARNSPNEDDSSPIVKAVLVTTTALKPPNESSGMPGDLTNALEFEARSSPMVSEVAVRAAPPLHPPRDSNVKLVTAASRETNVRPQIPMPRSKKQIPLTGDARTTLATSASTGEDIFAARQRMGVDILSAAVSVASAMKDGPWPSPCRSLLPEAIAARELNPHHHLDSHEEHMTIVGASLIQYARDVIMPSFLVAQDSGTVDSLRVVVGTMVLLREALVMNAGSIFRIQPEVLDFSPDENAGVRQTKTLFVTKILATSIILYALESMAEESTHLDSSEVDSRESLEQAFLRAVKAYDGAGDEYLHFAARPLGDSDVPILPSGAELEERERRAWQLTVNVQRSRHALLQLGLFQGDETSLPRILPVEPTVAHVTVLEEQRG